MFLAVNLVDCSPHAWIWLMGGEIKASTPKAVTITSKDPCVSVCLSFFSDYIHCGRGWDGLQQGALLVYKPFRGTVCSTFNYLPSFWNNRASLIPPTDTYICLGNGGLLLVRRE